MKKIIVVLVLMCYILAGCGEKSIKLEQIESSWTYVKDGYQCIVYVVVVPQADFDNLTITYEILSGSPRAAIDTKSIYIGDVKSGRKYFAQVRDVPEEYYFNAGESEFKVTAVKGKAA